VHYVGHYTISFQNSRFLQHKIQKLVSSSCVNCMKCKHYGNVTSLCLSICAGTENVCFSGVHLPILFDICTQLYVWGRIKIFVVSGTRGWESLLSVTAVQVSILLLASGRKLFPSPKPISFNTRRWTESLK
jgi:hypothetical protein